MISVCMAYYNRPEVLKKTLDSYERWYKDLDLEIVICDDGSDPILLDIDTSFKHRILHLPESKPLNPCVPLNRAIEASSGERIVITSPEIEHRHPALYDMLWRWNDEKDYIAAACYDERRGVLASKNTKHMLAPKGGQYHFCVLLHRNLFPGYDEDYRFGQAFDDNDILWRLAERGANFVCSDIPVYHNHSPVRWRLPMNDKLFAEKWPEERRNKL